jgi:hypothetical protein
MYSQNCLNEFLFILILFIYKKMDGFGKMKKDGFDWVNRALELGDM